MNADSHSFALLASSDGRSWVNVAAWIGAGVFACVLLVLTRSRWGQAQPLTRCAILSIFAHLIFAVYAATVHVMFSPAPPPPEEVVVQIAFIDEDPDQESAKATPPSPSRTDEPKKAKTKVVPTPEPKEAPPLASTADQKPEAAPKSKPAPLQQRPPAVPDRLVASPPKDQPKPRRDKEPMIRPPRSRDEPSAPTKGIPFVGSPLKAPSFDKKRTEAKPKDEKPAASRNPAKRSAQPLVPVESSRDRLAMRTPRVVETPNPKAAPNGRAKNRTEEAPPEAPAPPEIYKLRTSNDRLREVERRGGSKETERAVRAALRWLAAAQSADGRWDASQWESGRTARIDQYDKSRKDAGARSDTGMTGLAILAFLGAGHTHLTGEHREAVRRGLEFLLAAQRSDGSLGGDGQKYEFMYCHGMALFALSEAYAMTNDPWLEHAVESGRQFTLRTQIPNGGWRYSHPDKLQRGDLGDTSQLGWQLMALKSAELGGSPIPEESRNGMKHFLSIVASGDSRGLAAYQRGQPPTHTMTAEALACRQFLGVAGPDDQREAAEYLLENLPSKEFADHYYWYYATLSLYQAGGDAWREWNAALATTLVQMQRNDGDLAGSWDPDRRWGAHGGRVFSTALCTLCLEVYYRYLPMYVEAAGRWKSTR